MQQVENSDNLAGIAEPAASTASEGAAENGERPVVDFGDAAQALFDHLPDATLAADARGRIVAVSAELLRLFGHSAKAVIGQPIEMLMPESVRERHVSLAEGYRAQPNVPPAGGSLELLALRADGTRFPVEIALSLLNTPAGLLTLASVREITDRKRLETSLRDSEAQYRQLVDNSPDMVWELDAAWRFKFVSTGMAKLLGYERAELLCQPVQTVLTAEALEAIRRGVAEREELERRGVETDIRSYDLEFMRKDGSTFPGDIRSRPVRDSERRIVGFLGVTRDHTERLRAEQALRESRDHLALAQSVGAFGSIRRNFRTGRVDWSDQIFRLFGVEPKLIQPNPEAVLAYVVAEDREAVRQRIERGWIGLEIEPIEFRIRRADGAERWLHLATRQLPGADGKPEIGLTTLQDITERKLAEQALREREERQARDAERYRTILNTASDGIHVVEEDGNLVEASASFLRGLGYPESPMPKLNVSDWDPDVKLEELRAIVRKRLDRPASRFETRHRRSDGSFYDADVFVHPVVLDGRRYLYCSARDITERKLAEEALEFSERRLREAAVAAEVGIYDHDHRSDTIYWSPQQRAIYGIGADEPITLALYGTFIHPDDRDRVMVAVARAHDPKGDGRFDIEARIVRRDGSVRWVVNRSQTVFEGEGADRRPRRTIGAALDVTDRRNTEEALRRRERHLALAQRLASMGSAEIDVKTGVSHWSEGMYPLLGIDPATAVTGPETLFQLVHPDDVEKMKSYRARWLGGERQGEIEFRIRRSGGDVRWIRIDGEFVERGNGQPELAIGLFYDITDRKAAEDELRLSREHLASAQRVGQIGSTEIDVRTGRVFWSENLFAMLGQAPRPEAPSLEEILAWTHPDDRERMRAIAIKSRRGLEAEPATFRIVRPDGEVRLHTRRAEVRRAEDGTPLRVIVTHQDVTDLRRSEEELRLSRAHLANAQRVGHVGSAMFSTDEKSLRWSDELFAILGVDPAATKPSLDTFLERVHPDDRAAFMRNREEELQGRPMNPLEMRIVRPDGEVRWIVRRSEPITGIDGETLMITSTLQDITDRKRIEEERASLERQLVQSQKLDAIGQLAGGVAHDFNNLLAVILGRMEMVEEALADRPKARDWVRSAIGAAQRGASLTKMMLAFARVQTLQPIELDPGAVVRDLAEMLRRTLGETITIKIGTQPEQWHCEADPGQLQNALINLAVNARDAMPSGGTLTIEIGNASFDDASVSQIVGAKPGDYVVLTVSDTGIGMTSELVERVFEPFFTTKEVGKGTGLGLSMVNGFVRQSGGFIKIYSEVGHGTAVRVYLPRKRRAADGPEIDRAAPQRGHESILVIEDNDELRELAEQWIGQLGYTVFVAADAHAGLRTLGERPEVDLLITDLVLPGGIDGVEGAKRAIALRPALKVLFMSGYSERSRLSDMGSARAPLLQKPFTTHELASKIRLVLDGR